jgi:hypothetical protein
VHGVPADLDLTQFVGASVYRIDIGMHMIYFRFDAAGLPSIGIEGDWEIRDEHDKIVDRSIENDRLPRDRDVYRVHVLLDRAVSGTLVNAPHSFELTFDSGHRLVVFDNSRQYESFHIEPPGLHI